MLHYTQCRTYTCKNTEVQSQEAVVTFNMRMKFNSSREMFISNSVAKFKSSMACATGGKFLCATGERFHCLCYWWEVPLYY